MTDRTRKGHDPFPPLPQPRTINTSDITDLGSFTARGNIRSVQWDGGGDLAGGADATATSGYLIDSAAGAAQFQQIFAFGGTFTDVVVEGDLKSDNWDGTDPASLSVFDTGATLGFYLDSSEGAAQFSGNVFVGGEIQFFNVGATEADDYWAINRSTADNFRIQFHESGGSTITRFLINDSGGIEFYDEVGAKVLDYQASADRWDFVGSITADDGSSGAVEIFPEGTLLDQGEVNSSTDITNVSGTLTELSATIQTIACDYAAQKVYVKVWAHITWKNMAAGSSYVVRCGVNGTERGIGQAQQYQPAATSSAGAGNTGSGGGGATGSAGTGATGSAGSGATGAGGGAHTHNVVHGSTRQVWTGSAHTQATITSSIPDASHTHTGPSHTHTGPSHTHTGPSHTHTGPSHTHDAIPGLFPMSATWVSKAADAIVADGSGNLTVAIFASGDAAADIDGWSISWEVLRRAA